jgi:hypothetical protein
MMPVLDAGHKKICHFILSGEVSGKPRRIVKNCEKKRTRDKRKVAPLSDENSGAMVCDGNYG